MSTNLVIANAGKLASTLGIAGDPQELVSTLKATAFKGPVTDAQMAALMLVASQYHLNPWTKEIYAFPDRNNGIVPVVGVDGWSRIINSHPQFDGMDFDQDAESCTCIIYRKDRGHPIKVTEWMDECKRDGVGPWKSHPKRMLRHKAMIQAARLAFGFTGVFDQDEAERIVQATTSKQIDPATGEVLAFDVSAALNEVQAAETLDTLQEVWKRRGAEAVAAQDKGGHAALKDAVKERKATIQGVVDVEVVA
jgi:phage recombination protein Bet